MTRTAEELLTELATIAQSNPAARIGFLSLTPEILEYLEEEVCDYCGERLGFCAMDCETLDEDFEE